MTDRTTILTDLAARVRRFTDQSGHIGEPCPAVIDGLIVTQHRLPTPLEATIYDPVVCLILQGAKELHLSERHLVCTRGQAVIVSHDTPLTSQISEASYNVPYLAMILRLDPAVLRSLIDDLGDHDPDEPIASSIQVGDADAALVDAMSRLFALNDRPQDVATLAPLITREIHYRLLKAEHGAALRRLVHRNGQEARISTAIAAIRNDLSTPMSIPELARLANMSPSAFHHHFKAITETTPLQYQKQLRLLEARRLLADGSRSVSDAAHAVGYRSATQFSREYTRAFGTAPRDTPHVVAAHV